MVGKSTAVLLEDLFTGSLVNKISVKIKFIGVEKKIKENIYDMLVGFVSAVEDELRKFLNRIKGVVCLRERLKIYAPTCYGKCVGEVEELISRINEVIGGSTVYDAEGSWFNERLGRVETEPVKVIEAAHHCLSEEEARKIVEAIADYARKTNQTSVAVYEGNFYIAETPELLEAYKKFKEKKPIVVSVV